MEIVRNTINFGKIIHKNTPYTSKYNMPQFQLYKVIKYHHKNEPKNYTHIICILLTLGEFT